RHAEAVLEQRAVRQPRQQIVVGLEIDESLGLHAIGNVSRRAVHAIAARRAVQFLGGVDRPDRQLEIVFTAATIARFQGYFDRARSAVRGQRLIEEIACFVEIVIIDECCDVAADQIGASIAEQLLDLRIQKADAAVFVEDVNDVRGTVDDEPVQFFRALQAVFHDLMRVFEAAFAHGAVDRREQFFRHERLFQVVVRAEAQGARDVVERRFATDHDDRGANALRAHEFHDVVAGRARHAQIQQQNVVTGNFQFLDGREAAFGALDLEVIELQQALQAVEQARIVIGNQNSRGAARLAFRKIQQRCGGSGCLNVHCMFSTENSASLRRLFRPPRVAPLGKCRANRGARESVSRIACRVCRCGRRSNRRFRRPVFCKYSAQVRNVPSLWWNGLA
ncbi:conserved hypothetical protein, partial [Ricinus communis]